MQSFCGKNHEKPYRFEEERIETDGSIMVRFKNKNIEKLAAPPKKIFNFLSASWPAPVPEADMIEIPDLQNHQNTCSQCMGAKKIKIFKCPECKGKGTVDFQTEYNSYSQRCKLCSGKTIIFSEDIKKLKIIDNPEEIDCPDCQGKGSCPATYFVEINCFNFDIEYLEKLKNLPGIKVAVVSIPSQVPTSGLFFKFEGGEGLLMPLYG
ncbi:MAG: hypothetical protein RBR08_14500 [Desulforegulaceae bacterium]|nr:hypothetical protein [Desulforegulaceae bacterium]